MVCSVLQCESPPASAGSVPAGVQSTQPTTYFHRFRYRYIIVLVSAHNPLTSTRDGRMPRARSPQVLLRYVITVNYYTLHPAHPQICSYMDNDATRQRIISSVFSKLNSTGHQETYAGHIKIWEDAGPDGKKPRYILLSRMSIAQLVSYHLQ